MVTSNKHTLPPGLTLSQTLLKRGFDILVAAQGLLLLWWLILIAYLVATLDTRQNGFFTQQRVGKNGKLFKVVKLRTMRNLSSLNTTVTTKNDPRITKIGSIFRKTKLDELPQLINVLVGQMSFVGPRPDVPGFADKLEEGDRIVLTVRPGITGPATLKFRHEEAILAEQSNPEQYNREVIFPEKVHLNREYVEKYSFHRDIQYILQTIFS